MAEKVTTTPEFQTLLLEKCYSAVAMASKFPSDPDRQLQYLEIAEKYAQIYRKVTS